MTTATASRWWLFGVVDDSAARPPGDHEGLHPEFARRLHRFCADHPGLKVLSGHRTSEEQKFLFDHQHEPNFNPANPPGQSNHEAIPFGEHLGLAADMSPESVFDSGSISEEQHDTIKLKYGLHFPLRHQENEDHHAQPVEVESAKFTGMPELKRWVL
jgi:hypothetical protein